MADRVMWNVCVPGPKNPNKPDEKTRWVTIGIAFEGKKPGSIRIILNAHPIGNDVFLFERDQEDGKADEPEKPKPAGVVKHNYPDGEIPF